MVRVFVKYNPYRLTTFIEVNGREIEEDSTLFKLVRGKRLQEWVGQFPQMLRDELNAVDFSVEFCGMDLDWDDFEDAFSQAKEAKIVNRVEMKFIEGKSDDDIQEKIVDIFTDLKEGPIEDFRDARLVKAFNAINNSVFPIHVIATMSSGKSTLINALLEKRLMPSQNEACTATITQILDTDNDSFSAVVYNEHEEVIREISELTYTMMDELNGNENVHRIAVEGNVPFLDSRNMALMLVDTPGPNNAQNQAHKNTTYRAISNDSNSLILYVLNATQLSTNDDANLLNYVADQIKKGGKQIRDRFLFVINKMDSFNPETERIENTVERAKKYLSDYGIEEPQIFLCSAFTALNLRTHLKNIDTERLTRSETKALPQDAQDTLPMMDKLVAYESMHLEQYSTLSPSAKKKLDYRLKQAEERGDIKEQALIHSGICSIEAAITAYVKKYAKTKKVKDLIESFQEVLESNEVLAKAKEVIATDEKMAKACAGRAEAVREKIKGGEEAKAFKQKIEVLNPMEEIRNKATDLRDNATKQATKIFQHYGEVITSRDEAKRLVSQFVENSTDAIAKMTAELESTINQEVMEVGENCLLEYQQKLTKIDETTSDARLDFDTVDLIKGALSTMRDNTREWCSDNFVSETVDDEGETSYEERVYYEKVGQEEEEVAVGTHKEKIGTKKVKVGSHEVKTGTRKVKNPKKKWWKLFTPKFVEEDVFETVNDYKDEDVYETVIDYQTVMRDIYEERREQIEKFSVETQKIYMGLLRKLRKNLDDGMDAALYYAEEQIKDMKQQFMELFEELDEVIQEKYDELEKCAKEQKLKEEELKHNKDILEWIEANKAEIDSILDL